MSDALETRYQLLHGESEAARAELARLKTSGREVVIVSACAVGVRCAADGRDLSRPIPAGYEDAELMPLCPEVLARLGVPRAELSLSGTRVVDTRGRDLTDTLDAGIRLADLLATQAGATRALLLDGSVTCGVAHVGDSDGIGRFTARLQRRSLPIVAL